MKKELRNRFLEQRHSLSQEAYTTMCDRITDLFFEQHQIEEGDVLHVFLPIVKKSEINTYLIIDRIRKEFQDVKIVVPVADFKTNQMKSVLFDTTTEIATNKYGIPEPVGGVEIDSAAITKIIMPLLAFDEKGHRIGYGGGFYDRFLELYPNNTKIGLSLFQPVEDLPFAEEHDIQLDVCITPEKVFNFQ